MMPTKRIILIGKYSKKTKQGYVVTVKGKV